jgi:hypothetical protein
MSGTPRRTAIAIGLLACVAIAAGACAGPTLPALVDPTEIVMAGLKSTEGARTVHIDATLDGSINVDPTGQGGPAPSLPLNGTTASADVDIVGGKAQMVFSVPAFLNLNGELIQIGTTSFVKTSLSGPLYETPQLADSLPVDPTDAAGLFKDLGDLLSADGVNPVKGDDVDCGGKRCYTVSIEVSTEKLAGLGAGALPSPLPIDLAAASLAITIRVAKDTYQLAGIRTVASLGEQGALTLDMTMSKWNEATNISPPPADQVKPAS